MISRLYDPDNGTVLIDNKNITKINLFDLRNSIGYITQEALLFSDSITNNIAFGSLKKTNQKTIENAAKMAAIHNNIISFKKVMKLKLENEVSHFQVDKNNESLSLEHLLEIRKS